MENSKGDMAKLNYIPDEDVKVHEEGAIRLISKAFHSHEVDCLSG